ncbi:hypothetical protein ABIA39_008555 [Nocardia sp. GAS34]|uniref:hypothetical protein n=1 Tax=unclassified Nocardia TaxID=2637762 RepID=UPI003D244679
MSDNSIRIDDGIELAELLQFINDWLATDQDARISLDLLAGPAEPAPIPKHEF